MWVQRTSVRTQKIWVKMIKNVKNQGDDAGNEGGSLGTAVEMTQNSNENDKFKEWKVKVIENEHICKNLVSNI